VRTRAAGSSQRSSTRRRRGTTVTSVTASQPASSSWATWSRAASASELAMPHFRMFCASYEIGRRGARKGRWGGGPTSSRRWAASAGPSHLRLGRRGGSHQTDPVNPDGGQNSCSPTRIRRQAAHHAASRVVKRTDWLSAPSETTTSSQTRSTISCRVTSDAIAVGHQQDEQVEVAPDERDLVPITPQGQVRRGDEERAEAEARCEHRSILIGPGAMRWPQSGLSLAERGDMQP
jgi:hypothetical protein